MSESCYKILNSLFVYDPTKRATASMCLHSPYFDENPIRKSIDCRPSILIGVVVVQRVSRATFRSWRGSRSGGPPNSAVPEEEYMSCCRSPFVPDWRYRCRCAIGHSLESHRGALIYSWLVRRCVGAFRTTHVFVKYINCVTASFIITNYNRYNK